MNQNLPKKYLQIKERGFNMPKPYEVNQVVQVTAVIYEKRDQVKQLKKMKFDEAFYKQPDLRSSMHNK